MVGYLIESLRLFGKVNDRWGFAWSLLHRAIVVRGLHQYERATVLSGAADAMMVDFVNRMFNWEHPEFIKKTLAEARAQSDATTWARGEALSSSKALVWLLNQPFLIG